VSIQSILHELREQARQREAERAVAASAKRFRDAHRTWVDCHLRNVPVGEAESAKRARDQALEALLETSKSLP
jgi:hypothetical protein